MFLYVGKYIQILLHLVNFLSSYTSKLNVTKELSTPKIPQLGSQISALTFHLANFR